MIRLKRSVAAPCLLALVIPLLPLGSVRFTAVAQDRPADPALTLDRIFNLQEFEVERFGPARWMPDGESYTTLEPGSAPQAGRDLVLCRAGTGAREVLVPAARLIPSGASSPLSIEDYAWSPDGKVLLIFTNSQRVWRQNTRGDYWTYDLASGKLRQIGHKFEPSTLMFAKLSPDGRRAAYVVKDNIYVEELASGKVRPLTSDGNGEIINGTSDWVYEEEFGVRDGFRCRPDGASIVFWQFDTRGVPVFSMINNTDALYPKVIQFKYPKAGEQNSAVRVGVVAASGGNPVWMKVPGDPRNAYIPRLEWAANSHEVVFQHLNRLQNTNNLLIGDAASGNVRTIFTDRDDA